MNRYKIIAIRHSEFETWFDAPEYSAFDRTQGICMALEGVLVTCPFIATATTPSLIQRFSLNPSQDDLDKALSAAMRQTIHNMGPIIEEYAQELERSFVTLQNDPAVINEFLAFFGQAQKRISIIFQELEKNATDPRKDPEKIDKNIEKLFGPEIAKKLQMIHQLDGYLSAQEKYPIVHKVALVDFLQKNGNFTSEEQIKINVSKRLDEIIQTLRGIQFILIPSEIQQLEGQFSQEDYKKAEKCHMYHLWKKHLTQEQEKLLREFPSFENRTTLNEAEYQAKVSTILSSKKAFFQAYDKNKTAYKHAILMSLARGITPKETIKEHISTLESELRHGDGDSWSTIGLLAPHTDVMTHILYGQMFALGSHGRAGMLSPFSLGLPLINTALDAIIEAGKRSYEDDDSMVSKLDKLDSAQRYIRSLAIYLAIHCYLTGATPENVVIGLGGWAITTTAQGLTNMAMNGVQRNFYPTSEFWNPARFFIQTAVYTGSTWAYYGHIAPGVSGYFKLSPQEALCKLLQIDPNSTEKEIKSSYRAYAKKIHPDKNKEIDTTALFEELSGLHTKWEESVPRREGEN